MEEGEEKVSQEEKMSTWAISNGGILSIIAYLVSHKVKTSIHGSTVICFTEVFSPKVVTIHAANAK